MRLHRISAPRHLRFGEISSSRRPKQVAMSHAHAVVAKSSSDVVAPAVHDWHRTTLSFHVSFRSIWLKDYFVRVGSCGSVANALYFRLKLTEVHAL